MGDGSDLFDVADNFKRAGTSSEAAADAAASARKLKTHDRICAALKAKPRTADELAGDLGLVLNTARARCSDLLRWGYIERTDEQRKTAAGKWADVLRVVRPDNETD